MKLSIALAGALLITGCGTRKVIGWYDSSKIFSPQEIKTVQATRDSLKKEYDKRKIEFDNITKAIDAATDSTLKASAQQSRVVLFKQLQGITNEFDAAGKPLMDQLNKALPVVGKDYDKVEDKATAPAGTFLNPSNDVT